MTVNAPFHVSMPSLAISRRQPVFRKHCAAASDSVSIPLTAHPDGGSSHKPRHAIWLTPASYHSNDAFSNLNHFESRNTHVSTTLEYSFVS